MKINKTTIWVFVAMVLLAALYRAIPGRPYGFAPHIALALFGGSVIKDKKWAFALPIFSLFLSDCFYHVLYMFELTPIKGFYGGQLSNYMVYASIVVFGFFLKEIKVLKVLGFSIAAATIFFLISNFLVWAGGGIDIVTLQPLTKNMSGLLQSYEQALPFYKNSLSATIIFGTVLFGGYYFLTKKTTVAQTA